MRHFERIDGKLVELDQTAFNKREVEGKAYYSTERLLSGEEVHVAWSDEAIAQRKIEESLTPSPPLVDRLAEIVKSIPDEVFADPAMVAFLGGAKLLADNRRIKALELAISNLPPELDQIKNAALQEVAKEK